MLSRYAANITSSGAVNISNDRGIAVGGKLTVKNASGTDNVTVTGNGNAHPLTMTLISPAGVP